MGIDLKAGGRVKKSGRSSPVSQDLYLRMLVKLYRFLARRTDSSFNATVLRRLFMSRINKPAVSISAIARHDSHAPKEQKDRIIAVVGSVLNDERFLNVPAMKVCALHFSETARARIVAAGGECMTFDQLALQRPTGSNCLLIRGKTSSRTATRYFGASGVPGSHARPYTQDRHKNRKIERARGRR